MGYEKIGFNQNWNAEKEKFAVKGVSKTRRLRDAASSFGRLAMSNLLYLVLGVCTTAAGSISR